ncbi:MAG: YggT family protein [Pseudomonadota bacterium]|nr:YggT family protein [Pseudomonadota bacterium]
MEANLIFYVLNTGISVVVALVCLRFLLQLAQVNFYNPISQGVNRFTTPLTAVFSGLPTVGPFNIGILVAAIVIQAVGAGLCLLLLGGIPGLAQLVIWSVLSVFGVMINLVFYALLGMIILSWLAPNASHPGAELLYELSEPFLAPFRKIIPDLGGLDLSPILLFIAINLIEAVVIRGPAHAMGLSQTVAQFFVGIG